MTQSDTGIRDQEALVDDGADVESRVRSYSRTWPTTFTSAVGDRIRSVTGESYLDFFMGAGALNYGHGNVLLREPLIDYLTSDGVVHSLDMATEAKSRFLLAISEQLLRPRGLDYKVQFTGPTGANAVEAALKLARKVTGRQAVVAFTRSFHGMSLGALAVTASADKRAAAGVPLEHVIRIPYEGFGRHAVAGLDLLEDLVDDPGGGIGVPAAVIVETVQGEGGVNVAGTEWLRRLAELCARLDMLLIVDDVQAGCGRTGPFFSFERVDATPDIVCLSKSLSGFGLPLAVVLFKRELDVWEPAEHNGTFRGSNPAFVTATAALRTYWSDDRLERSTGEKGAVVADHLAELCARYLASGAVYRGTGLIWGLEFSQPGLAEQIGRAAFRNGLLVETSGPRDEVVKLLPSLLISTADLVEGLKILAASVEHALATSR